MARFQWSRELQPDGETGWRYVDNQTGQTGLMKDMGTISTDYTWPAYIDWKEQYGSEFDDPQTEFLKQAKMYPGEYVKELAQQMHNNQAIFYHRYRLVLLAIHYLPTKLRKKVGFWFWKLSFRGRYSPPRRWLWLTFKYGMLENPWCGCGLFSLDNITYDRLLKGTYVADRNKLRLKFSLWLTVTTFRVYSMLPGTYYQHWKQEQGEQKRQIAEMRRRHIERFKGARR